MAYAVVRLCRLLMPSEIRVDPEHCGPTQKAPPKNVSLNGVNMKASCLVSACILALVSLSPAQRLPAIASPDNYKLAFAPDFSKDNFSGDETIHIHLLKATPEITLNAADLEFQDVTITAGGSSQKAEVTLDKEKEQATLAVGKMLQPGPMTNPIKYTRTLNREFRGFYLGEQNDRPENC